jgi:hypothetical protein
MVLVFPPAATCHEQRVHQQQEQPDPIGEHGRLLEKVAPF